MKRLLNSHLLEWKHSNARKPLILEGARQVGKTWLLDEFGTNEYKHYIKINCDNNPNVQDLFTDYDVNRIFRILSASVLRSVYSSALSMYSSAARSAVNRAIISAAPCS